MVSLVFGKALVSFLKYDDYFVIKKYMMLILISFAFIYDMLKTASLSKVFINFSVSQKIKTMGKDITRLVAYVICFLIQNKIF